VLRDQHVRHAADPAPEQQVLDGQARGHRGQLGAGLSGVGDLEAASRARCPELATQLIDLEQARRPALPAVGHRHAIAVEVIRQVRQELLECLLRIAGKEHIDDSADPAGAGEAGVGPAPQVVRVQIPVQAEQADAERSGTASAARPLVPEPDREIGLDRRRPQPAPREQRLQAAHARLGRLVAPFFVRPERLELRPDVSRAETEL
jgi:hypothetical protein